MSETGFCYRNNKASRDAAKHNGLPRGTIETIVSFDPRYRRYINSGKIVYLGRGRKRNVSLPPLLVVHR